MNPLKHKRAHNKPAKPKMPEAIAWDFGDTLVRLKTTALEKVIVWIRKSTGKSVTASELSTAIQLEWHARSDNESEQIIKAVKTRTDEYNYWTGFYRSVLSRLGINSASDELVSSCVEIQLDPRSFELLPDAPQTLKQIKQERVKLILISNAFPSATDILKYHKLDKYFDHIIMSYEISSLKPEPEIYEHALRHAKVSPDSALFIDDRLRFVVGARNVGMMAVWLNAENAHSAEWEGKQIGNVKEVITLAGFPECSTQGIGRFSAERATCPIC